MIRVLFAGALLALGGCVHTAPPDDGVPYLPPRECVFRDGSGTIVLGPCP